MFPQPGEQAKALGVYGFVASAGGSIGLLSGGVLTDLISWHWIFFINLPIGIVTGVLALRLIEPRPGIGLKAGADLRGAALLTVGVMLGVYTILGITEHGWASDRTLGLGGIAAVLLVAFLVRQARIAEPADAAAPVPLAQRHRLQHRDGDAGGRHVRPVLPRRPVPAAHPRLLPARGRPRLPAVDGRDGRRLAALLASAGDEVRPAQHADPGAGDDRRAACCCSPARRSTAPSWSTSCRARC